MKPRCPNCDSLMVYFRTRSEDFLCRSCGKTFKVDDSPNPNEEPESEMERRTR